MAVVDTLNLILFCIICLDGITGFYLIFRGIQRKLYNTLLLGAGFVGAMVSVLLVVIFELSWNQIALLFMLSFYSAIPFTHITFHKKLNKPYRFIYAITGLMLIIKVIFAHFDEKSNEPHFEWVSSIFEFLVIFVSFGWMGYSAFVSYRNIKNDPIAPWIKQRIRLFASASLAMALQGFPQILLPIFGLSMSSESSISIAIAAIGLILTGIFAFGNILAWFMPEFLKNYFNREYKETDLSDLTLTEEEIMNRLREGK